MAGSDRANSGTAYACCLLLLLLSSYLSEIVGSEEMNSVTFQWQQPTTEAQPIAPAVLSSDPTTLEPLDASYAQLALQYNKILGTHQIEPRYQFEPTQHYMYEGAQRMLKAGFTSFKFKFQPQFANQTIVDLRRSPMTLVQIATDPAFSIQAVMDLPFTTFFMYIKIDSIHTSEVGISKFTEYLMRRYQGTGKTFMLGTWKADSLLRYWVGWPGYPNATTPYDPAALKSYPQRLQQHTAGVQRARDRLSGTYRGVQVYSYIEVNLMKNATVPFTVIDDIIPNLDPAPDYISVSTTTLAEYVTDLNPAGKLYPMLDHVKSRLLDKPGIPGTRVLIGEFEFPRLDRSGNPDPNTPTQEAQAQHALAVAAAAVSWGTPYALWWTFYDNTRTIKDAATGVYQDRGFGLVSCDNQNTVLYDALLKYFTDANAWLYGKIKEGGVSPCFDDFRVWAASKLVDLAKGIGGPDATRINLPTFITRDC